MRNPSLPARRWPRAEELHTPIWGQAGNMRTNCPIFASHLSHLDIRISFADGPQSLIHLKMLVRHGDCMLGTKIACYTLAQATDFRQLKVIRPKE